ncbi:MAG: hypothetical protein MJZ69_04030 [Bacteroidaceae bacterium]|nr:hypothetical protein [Bacteroidaceae bacterium]
MEVPDAAPSVYYWRTTYTISEKERAWIKENKIEKIYLRLFDVVQKGDHDATPQATLQIKEDLPQHIELIPTVYVDEPVIRTYSNIDSLAVMIVRRVAQMASTHNFKYHELQIDCDWTKRSEERFFQLLRKMKEFDDKLVLSSTIRLHQLAMKAPPVDYGALMLYNTGNFRTADSNDDHNPILDARDVKPYLRYLADYKLPLCTAYPNFNWQLLFAKGQFKGILYGEDLNDSTSYRKVADDQYVVVTARDVPLSMGHYTIHLHPGQMVKVWRSAPQQINEVKTLVESCRSDINNQTIIYHLDEKNISKI